MQEVKSLDGWTKFTDETGNGDLNAYLQEGDVVDEAMVDYFMNLLPPRTMSYGYLQIGEPRGMATDENGKMKETYGTFAKYEGLWHYQGNCFPYETTCRR